MKKGNYNVKLEIQLIKLGFKRHWLSDKSGYWFEKETKFKDLKLKFIVETDYKLALMQVQTGEYFNSKFKLNQWEDVFKFKCNLQTIKETLKRYK